MPEIVRLTPREETVWDTAYAFAFVVYQEALRATITADSSILALREFENSHPERSLPACEVFK